MMQFSPHSHGRPGYVPTFAGVLVAVMAAGLGAWQMDRAEQKCALQARLDAGTQQGVVLLDGLPSNPDYWLYRRVRIHGTYAAAHQVFLDNRLHEGQPGYHVVAPLQLDGDKRAVLVNRGWLPLGPDRSYAPFASVPAGRVQVEGILVRAQTRYLELSGETVRGRVWQNLDLERYREFYSPSLPDLMLLQTGAGTDGLLREWPRFDAGVEKHLNYAGQWFLLAVLSGGLTLYHLIRRRRIHAARTA